MPGFNLAFIHFSRPFGKSHLGLRYAGVNVVELKCLDVQQSNVTSAHLG